MTHVTCRLTAENRDQLRNPTLHSRVWATFTFLHRVYTQPRCVAVDTLGFFSIGPTNRSNMNLQFFEASIRSNGNITRALVLSVYGGRRYPFIVTVSSRRLYAFPLFIIISRALPSMQIPATRLRHRPLRGVDSVRLQILSTGTCRQCGSWSVAGHNHRKVTGRDPFVQVSMTWALTCLETVRQRPCI